MCLSTGGGVTVSRSLGEVGSAPGHGTWIPYPATDIWWSSLGSSVADPGFSQGGANSPGGGGCQHTILPKFPENCMKLKEFGCPGGGGAPCAPPKSATGFVKTFSLEDLPHLMRIPKHVRLASGQYASHWNRVLFVYLFLSRGIECTLAASR